MKIYCKLLLVPAIATFSVCAQAQSVTFDFDNAPQHAPLPLYLTAGGITGHFSSGSPYYNYSIQAADVLVLLRRVSPVCVYFRARFTSRTSWSPSIHS